MCYFIFFFYTIGERDDDIKKYIGKAHSNQKEDANMITIQQVITNIVKQLPIRRVIQPLSKTLLEAMVVEFEFKGIYCVTRKAEVLFHSIT